MEFACHYLQPVIGTVQAFSSVQALDVEVVGEVKRESEAKFYRNDVLTGDSMWWWIRVSWTGQMSLWLFKYTTGAGY